MLLLVLGVKGDMLLKFDFVTYFGGLGELRMYMDHVSAGRFI